MPDFQHLDISAKFGNMKCCSTINYSLFLYTNVPVD